MELKQEQSCRKKNGKECSFEFKTFVIEQINNGQISVNFAAKKYNVSRSTLDYWRKKLSNYESKQVNMSLEKENKKLRDRLEELEFVKDFQQDLIANFELVISTFALQRSHHSTAKFSSRYVFCGNYSKRWQSAHAKNGGAAVEKQKENISMLISN